MGKNDILNTEADKDPIDDESFINIAKECVRFGVKDVSNCFKNNG